VFVLASGIAGTFVRDATVTVDNGGTEIVGVHGWRRVFDGGYSVEWFGASGGGVDDDSVVIRSTIAAAPAGGTIHFPAGTYLVSQDGENVWCIQFAKRVHITADPGAEIKANTAGVRTVLRFDAKVTSDAPLVVNGNSKTNFGVEVNSTGAGSYIKGWEAKNVTQQHSSALQAACFRTASAVGVTFDNCYAHDAISYVNSVEGDNAGAARGFLFDGTNASAFGVNAVQNCRIDNIINDRGASGDYEDEDGIVTQMANSRLVAQGNFIAACMKRGIKLQNPATVTDNVIVSSRTLGNGAGAQDSAKGMFAGVSVYSDDCKVERNLIASASCFDGVTGGSFAYGVEVGITATAGYRNSVVENTIKIGPATNARARELISIRGAQVGLRVTGNKVEIENGLTLSNTYGLRIAGNHATIRATVNIEDNDFSYITYGMYLQGGFSGTIRGNKIRSLQGPWGIAVDTHALTLSPKSLDISHNEGFGLASNYTVRVNDTGVSGLTLVGNTSDSTSLRPCFVAAGVRYTEVGSSGPTTPASMWGSAPPTSGTFASGDIVFNVGPGSGDPIGWRCVIAGTPGTWEIFMADEVDTAANIASAAASINTVNKYAGRRVWDSTNNRELRASGSLATSVWHVVDGSVTVTPA
jgi:uncharacterized membrane protein